MDPVDSGLTYHRLVYATSNTGSNRGDHNGPSPDRGSREPRRLCSANSLCPASVPEFSSPPDPNKVLGLRAWAWSCCRVCSGGGDVELTKPDRFRPPSSIHENPASVRDGRTFDREAVA